MSRLQEFGIKDARIGSFNNGAYINRIPRLTKYPPETRLLDLHSVPECLEIGDILVKAGLTKGERAAVSRTIGEMSYLVDRRTHLPSIEPTINDIRRATIEELANIEYGGYRSAKILKALFGDESIPPQPETKVSIIRRFFGRLF